MSCIRSSNGTTVKDSPCDLRVWGVQQTNLVFLYERHTRFCDVSVTFGTLCSFDKLLFFKGFQSVYKRVFYKRATAYSLRNRKLVASLHKVVVDYCGRFSRRVDLVQILEDNYVYFAHPVRSPSTWHLVNTLFSVIVSMMVRVPKLSELTKFLVRTHQTLIAHPSEECDNDCRAGFGEPQEVGFRAGVATPDPVVAKRMLTNAPTDYKNTVRNDDTIGNDCPNCGDQITAISTRGPQQHFASPCNCQISAVEVNDL